MNKYSNISCLGYTVFADYLETIDLSKKTTINTINQYSYCIAEEDSVFKKALKASDVLLPDGIGIVYAAKFLKRDTIKKIAGADLHNHLLNKLNKESGSCFYLGSSDATLQKIQDRVSKEYPNIKTGVYSPPYKPAFSDEDNKRMLEAVNTFSPDVLFIGMTAPKQEKWSIAHKDNLDAKIICSIGAVFDFYAGTIDRPNRIWIKLGLEWMGRLVKEPKRMWKRYIYYGAIFGFVLFKAKMKKK